MAMNVRPHQLDGFGQEGDETRHPPSPTLVLITKSSACIARLHDESPSDASQTDFNHGNARHSRGTWRVRNLRRASGLAPDGAWLERHRLLPGRDGPI